MMLLQKAKVKYARGKQPIGQAITISQASARIDFWEKHGVVKILIHVPSDGPGVEGWRLVEAIHRKTDPLHRWSQCLNGRADLRCRKQERWFEFTASCWSM